MKKILLSAFAIFAMMACNNEEPVRLQEQSLITFEDSFVEAKTRAEDPSITTTTINAFDVWGFINQPSGIVFDKERVTKSEDGVWGYTNLQYWMPEKSYYFHAVAPVDDANIVVDTKEMKTDGLGTISFTNVDGTTDLIYASKHVPTGSDVINNAPAPVELKFMHLLSKIKFTFKNGFLTDNTSLKVTEIKITDAPAKGSVEVNKARQDFEWDIPQGGATTELAFGDVNGGVALAALASDECAAERLTIPADANRTYTITFKLELFYGDQSAGVSNKTVTLENQEFAIGKNYNITATIDHTNFYNEALKPIEFTVVEVEKWDEGDVNGNIHDSESTNPEQPEQPAEPEVLATPVVASVVEGNVVTLNWDAVEGAKAYSVQVNDGEVETVEDTTYTFTGEYGVSYTFTIKALPENEETHKASEAVVTVEIPAQTTPEPEQPTYTSVADFLAAEVNSDTYYYLKGTITRVANTTYGNFDLTDETGTIYVYGLNSEDGAISKYWAQSGAKLGDDIVIYALRSEYKGQDQAGDARFIELLPGTLAFWTFSKDAVVFGSAAAEQEITVEAYNLKGDIEYASDNAHFTATYADGVLTIAAAENATTENISGNITVTAGDLKKVITVTQTGVSVGGGTEVSVEKTMKDFGWANAAAVKEIALDDNVKVVFAQGKASTAPAYYTSGEAVRLYQNGATMAVSANGKTIKSMEITFAQSQYYMAPDCGEFSAEGEVRTWTGEATEVKFTTTGTDKTHRAYIAKIKVTYID